MAESIIAPSLSLREKFDLLNSAKEIIPLGETKTFSGKRYTQAEALAELNAGCPNNLHIVNTIYDTQTYSLYQGPWSWAMLFINGLSSVDIQNYQWGIVYRDSVYCSIDGADVPSSTASSIESFSVPPQLFIGHGNTNYMIPFSYNYLGSITSNINARCSLSIVDNTIMIKYHPIIFDDINTTMHIRYQTMKVTISGCIAIF